MQKKQTNILFVSLLLFLTFSCSVSKKNIVKNFSDDEKENVFIYLFDEAGKNRLNGNLQKAEEQYLASLEVNPQSAASYFYLASIYIARKDYQSALNFSKKAVEINPENYWYLLEKADLLKINGKENDAEIIYKKLLNKNPKNESVYDKLSEIYSKNNDIKKLIGLYELKSRKYDDSPETLLTLFNLYLKDKNYKKAEQIITSAEKKYPDNFKIKGTAAEFFYSTGKKEKAEKIYKKLLSEYPDNTDINLSYAFFCKKTGKEDEYFEITKKLMSSDLDVYKKINLLTSGRYNNFPPDKHFILLKDLYNRNPDDITVNSLFAEYYLNEDKKNEAIPYLKKMLELNPSDFNIALTLFALLYDVKNFTLLADQTEKYITYFPNRPKVYLYNAIAELELKHYDKVERALETGKNLVVENNELENQFKYYSVLLYKEKNDYKKALHLINSLSGDKHLKISELKGDLLFLNGEKQKALDFWKKAKNEGNNTKNLNYKIEHFKTLTEDDIK